jgi:predicted DNA-binding protein YlxM (UPF0122 family)
MCKEKYLTNRLISDKLNHGKGKILYRRCDMEWIVEQTLLYDFYGELLTEHQKEIYEDHVLNDLSPSEIAGEHGITRQAAYDMIRRCNKILAGYEKKLHLVEKFLRTKEKVTEIHLLAKSILHADDQEEIKIEIRKIEQVSNGILEDL